MQRDQMTEEQYLRAQLAEMAQHYEEAIKPYITRLAALAREREGPVEQLAALQEIERFRTERAPTIDAPTIRAVCCPGKAYQEVGGAHEGPIFHVLPWQFEALQAPTAVELTAEELELVRQWFNAVQDLNPHYLEPPDYGLARKIYQRLGIRVPSSILATEEGHKGPHRSPEATAVKESRGARHIPKEGDDFCAGAPGKGSVVGVDAARKGVTDAFFVSLFKTLVEDKGAK